LLWRLGMEGVVIAPTAAGVIKQVEGRVDVRVLAFGGGLVLNLTDPADRFGATASLGAAATAVLFGGKSAGTADASRGVNWSAFVYGDLGASYAIVPLVAVRADVQAGALLPRQIVRVVGRDVAVFGWPLIVASLGVELRP
jgi:hypothetical protein